jgi:hypothetical protein
MIAFCYVAVDGRVIGDATDFHRAVVAMFASYHALNMQDHEAASASWS